MSILPQLENGEGPIRDVHCAKENHRAGDSAHSGGWLKEWKTEGQTSFLRDRLALFHLCKTVCGLGQRKHLRAMDQL